MCREMVTNEIEITAKIVVISLEYAELYRCVLTHHLKNEENAIQNISQGTLKIKLRLRLNASKWGGGYPRGVMGCEIVVCEFVLQSCYYVHFRANTLGKGMNPLILTAMG